MITHDILGTINNVINYSLYCSAQPQNWIGCAMFWAVLYCTLTFIALLVFVATAYKVYKDKRDYKAYLKKKADREKIAPPEVMEQHIWRADFD